MREIPSKTGGDVTSFSDNPDIRKRFGIRRDRNFRLAALEQAGEELAPLWAREGEIRRVFGFISPERPSASTILAT